MSRGWSKSLTALWRSAQDVGLTLLVLGGAQVLVALVLWPILFRSFRQGFSMALSLVGFGSWLLAFATSFGRGRRRMGPMSPGPSTPESKTTAPTAESWTPRAAPSAKELLTSARAQPVADRVQAQVQQMGCGLALFLCSLVPLALAFALRVNADLRSGMTWRDIFPPMP